MHTCGFDSIPSDLGVLHRQRDMEARHGVLETLSQQSPTSLKVAYKQLTAYNALEFEDAMRLEYRLAVHCNFGHEFFEGIRAQVVDKDCDPRWRPARLEDVTPDIVDAFFEAPATGDMTFA